MSLSAKKLSSLLQTLYEAASQPQLFADFLAKLSAELAADKAYFILVDSEARCNFSLQYGFDDSASRAYAEYFSGRDPLAVRFFEKAKSHREWVGTSRSVISDSEYLSSEIFNDFARPNRQRYFCAAGFDLSGSGLEGGLGVARPPDAKEFDGEAVELLAVLAPHMRQALMLYKSLADSIINNALLKMSAQHFEHALICLDSSSKVLRITPAARTILEMGDGLTEDRGCLRVSCTREQERLNAMIAQAVATGTGRGGEHPVQMDAQLAPEIGRPSIWTSGFGGSMQVSRKPPRRPLTLTVTPFLASGEYTLPKPCAMVILSDPDFTPLSRSVLLRCAYGLTPSECRIAELLAQGHTVSEAAEMLGRTQAGARFQLKSIFRKTDTRRQTDLLRLILSLPGTED